MSFTKTRRTSSARSRRSRPSSGPRPWDWIPKHTTFLWTQRILLHLLARLEVCLGRPFREASTFWFMAGRDRQPPTRIPYPVDALSWRKAVGREPNRTQKPNIDGRALHCWYTMRSFGVRQLVAAFLPASLLAGGFNRTHNSRRACWLANVKTSDQPAGSLAIRNPSRPASKLAGEKAAAKLPHSKASRRISVQVVRGAVIIRRAL